MRSRKLLYCISYIFLSVMVLFSLLTLIPVRVSAKEINRDVGFSTVLYDNSNGLLASEANAVAQAGIGFIWIGGYGGLTRYDGIEFRHFDPTSGISSVNCLYIDSKDRLWIGTNDSGLAVRQNAQFQFFGSTDGLVSLSVRAICEDSAGNIIIATTEGMAYIDNDNKLHMINDHKIDEKYVRRLTVDKD